MPQSAMNKPSMPECDDELGGSDALARGFRGEGWSDVAARLASAVMLLLALACSRWLASRPFPASDRDHAAAAASSVVSAEPSDLADALPTGRRRTVAALGLTVADHDGGGALVCEVDPIVVATGVRSVVPGDQVVALNNHPVSGPDDLATRVAAASGQIMLQVRDGLTGECRTLVVLVPSQDQPAHRPTLGLDASLLAP